jgi:hypothetical protein
MSQPFRIPSLDGGGIMGAFAASALATVVRETDRRIAEHDHLMSRRDSAAPPEPSISVTIISASPGFEPAPWRRPTPGRAW